MNKSTYVLFIFFLGLILSWEYASIVSSSWSLFASSPSSIVKVWSVELFKLDYWDSIKTTSLTLITGYTLAVCLGYLSGLFAYYSKQKGVDLNLALMILGSIPVFAVAPLLILAFGVGFSSRVSVVVLSCIFLIASGVYQAIRYTDEEYGSIMRDLGASKRRLWIKVLIPGGLIYSIPTLKGAVALSMIGVFVAEWISSQVGIGKYILSAMSLYDSPRLMIGIFTFMIISGICMGVISFIELKTMEWRKHR
ncbi:MAG: ABC transporter permease subunit [Saprospiraceae bacterium]|nr:ABC transporter permease subunit [Saprospiraceae bacterium]